MSYTVDLPLEFIEDLELVIDNMKFLVGTEITEAYIERFKAAVDKRLSNLGVDKYWRGKVL